MMLVEMLSEAGCPPGVVNIIHGSVDTVNFICDAPDIKAISFVGANIAVTNSYIICNNLLHLPWVILSANILYIVCRVNIFIVEVLKMVKEYKAIWVQKIMV